MKADQYIKATLEAAKIDLLMNFPFFGVLASKMPMVEVKSCRTMATDYRRIYYNPEFVKGLTHDKRVFAVAHELYHCVYNHFIRRENRDPEYWNMAADYAINYDLCHETYTKNDGTVLTGIGTIDPNWLYDAKYANMSAEEIYDLLVKNQVPKMQTQDVHLIPGAGNGDNSLSDEVDDTDDGVDIGQEDEDALPEIPEMPAEDAAIAAGEFMQTVFSVESSTDPGKLPGRLRRFLKDLREPKKNWRDILRSKIESSFKPHRTWINPHRRSWTQGFILPGPAPEKAINIAVAIDLSGSISSDQAADLLSELQGIMDQFKHYKITVWTFDTKVYYKTSMEFTESNKLKIEDFKLRGGGGTYFGANWIYMKKAKIKPDRFLMFTDGFCGFNDCDPCYVDTLWLIHSKMKFNPPFGTALKYEE